MSDSQELIGDRYRLLEQIGRGGMGTVWRARDEVLGRDVAVKEVTPSPDLTGPEREVFTIRTFREARAAGRIGHPGVATVYDVIEEHGHPWIVMQLVDSRTLGAVVREDGPLPPARVARIGLDVLGALLAAHHVGVLHRDVKPDNVLLARDGRAVLTDFGIAVLEGDASVTGTGALIGTPAFIAPERASGGPAEFASDLWSLGVTLYMAVEGCSPFERAHPLATLSAVVHQHPKPLRFAGPLGPVIFGLLRKDPAQRMSAQEVQTRLGSIVNGIAPPSTMPIDLPNPAAVPVATPSSAPDSAQESAPVAVTSSASDPGPVLTPLEGRRRPALAAVMAAALAAAMTAGGMAWVASNSLAPNPAKPPSSAKPSTSANVPVKEPTPENTPEQARVPVRNDPAPARTGNASGEPSSRPTSTKSEEGKPTPSDEPSGKPSSQDDSKPSQDDPGKPSQDGSGDSSEDDSNQNPDQNPEQEPDGNSSGQVPPDVETPSLGARSEGESKPRKIGKTKKVKKRSGD